MEQTVQNPAEEKEQPTAPSALPSALEEYKAMHNGKNPPMTGGEKFFNFANYYGAGGILNGLIGLTMADLTKHTHLQPACRKLYQFMGESLTNFMVLSLGGFVMLWPQTFAEKHKRTWVGKLDHLLGKQNKTPEEDLAIAARYEFLEHEPEQTFKSELASRVVGMAMNGMFTRAVLEEGNAIQKLGGSFKGIEPKTTELAERTVAMLKDSEARPYIAKRTMALEENLAKTPQAIAGKFSAAGRADEFNKLTGEDRLKQLVKLSYLEVIFTSSMSFLQFAWSRVMAPIFGKQEAAPSCVTHSSSPTTLSKQEYGHVVADATAKAQDAPDTKISQPSLQPTKEAEKGKIVPVSLMEQATRTDASGALQL